VAVFETSNPRTTQGNERLSESVDAIVYGV
jgi:hypothetical protein